MRLLAIFATLIALFPAFASAQDRPNTVLVLDASGSMWGQIDGVAKITIAQEVVTDLLQTFPADENLGLTIYGARTRGDCTDIQTVVEPGTGNRDRIASAVAAIKPLGKTPMTDAIIAAAEALRYTEDSATVILVSDGVETCNPDPCAAARLLEENGIGFTAHVIGFDVGSDPDALAQMQCIADETGGQFLTAANASELTSALEQVSKAPEPPAAPLTGQITFMAVEDGGFIALDEPIVWNVTAADGTVVIADRNQAVFTEDLPVGVYTVTALRLATEDTVTADLTVLPAPGTKSVAFPAPLPPQATLTAPDTSLLGATIPVGWTGPNEENDYVSVAKIGDDGYINYTRIREGNPLELLMPTEPGDYEIRYVLNQDGMVVATRPITVAALTVSVTAQDQAVAGSLVTVGWDGPDYERDYISVASVGDDGYINYARTSEGNPLELLMPTEPGTYEIRYVLNQDAEVLATRTITITALKITIDAVAEAVAGSTVAVSWEGPDYQNDYIAVSEVGTDGYVNYARTSEGNPTEVLMPTAPGEYELRYVLNQDSMVAARRPITITALKVQLVAPATIKLGETLTIGWDGPGYERDYISIGVPGAVDYINYTRISDGNPLTLELPDTAGDYEIRYQLNQDGVIVGRLPITVTKE